MTSPGRYAASDGSFARSTGNAAARGGILIGIAVLIGLVLLWKGLDGDDATAAAGDNDSDAELTDENSDDTSDETVTDPGGDVDDGTETSDDTSDADVDTDPTVTTPTTEAAEVDPPAEVLVAVLNGTGEGGLAGLRSNALSALGYQVSAGNASGVPVDASGVYYTSGYADEAKVVAEGLGGSSLVLNAMPADPATLATESAAADAAAANIIVVLGADGVLS